MEERKLVSIEVAFGKYSYLSQSVDLVEVPVVKV